MAAGDFRIGLDGKFKHGNAGSTPSTISDNVDNVTLGLSARSAQALRRGKTWVMTKVTALEATLDFEVWDIEGDGLISALKTAYMGKTRIALYPTDAASGEGLDADWYITAFGRNETNEDFIKYSVTAQPTDEVRDPNWQ